MKRIIMVLTVAHVVLAMAVATSMPAFAAIACQNPGGQSPQGNCQEATSHQTVLAEGSEVSGATG